MHAYAHNACINACEKAIKHSCKKRAVQGGLRTRSLTELSTNDPLSLFQLECVI